MKKYATVAAVTLLLASSSPVLALGTESFGNAPVVNQPEWAKGVLDVVNLNSRVYSVWVNGNEHFYYSGNARELNEAIRKFGDIQADVHRLILLPGTGKTQTFAGKPVPYDWQLHVPSGIYKAVSKQNHAEMTVYVNGLKPQAIQEPKRIANWLRQLDDEFPVREEAQKELEKLGNDAKPLLREALKNQPSPETRRRIETMLGKLRGIDVTDLQIPKGVEVVIMDDLLAEYWKGSKDPDQHICSGALYGLSSFASYDAKIVPALIEMLKKDKNEYIRRVAASCLGDLDISTEAVVTALKEGLTDPDANIRNHFQATLERIEKAKEKREQSKEKPEQEDRLKRERAISKEIAEFKKAIGEKK
ncbi:MAG TPA: HEAT repeat domain-containing protein [Gemmata sp.]|nr:HEAT repeat domain-containing protein [Gemmata sp.]